MDTKESKGEQSESGFYCDVCDCIVKDSLNYLDHINGKRHNKNLGISLKNFADSTLEEVKAMLAQKKRERDEMTSGYNDEDRERDEAEKWKRLKREKKKRQKARRSGASVLDNEDGDSDEEEIEAGFGRSGKAEIGHTAEGDDDDDEEDYDQDDMARLMGFSNFSTSKK